MTSFDQRERGAPASAITFGTAIAPQPVATAETLRADDPHALHRDRA